MAQLYGISLIMRMCFLSHCFLTLAKFTNFCGEMSFLIMNMNMNMETTFRFDSEYFANISLIAGKCFTDRDVNIHINNKQTIQIPLLIAVSLSPVITQQYLSDPSSNDYYINVSLTDSECEHVISQFSKALVEQEEIKFTNEDDILTFSLFGQSLDNKEMMKPIIDRINSLSQNIDESNVISLLEDKIKFKFTIEYCEPEISFISSHFTTLKTQIIELSKNEEFTPIIESIIKHDSLQLSNEDELLEFILTLCKIDNKYETFFSYVLLIFESVIMNSKSSSSFSSFSELCLIIDSMSVTYSSVLDMSMI